MAQFRNTTYSHEHSLEILDVLYGYDSFLDNLTTIADMGCGEGADTEWWATLTTRDDPPEPHNYTVYAVDKNRWQFDENISRDNPNIQIIEADFETVELPTKPDVIWCHDSFQYAQNPLKCLKHWRSMMNVNGMLILAVPQTTFFVKHKLTIANHSHQYYNYNILNLMYLLAMSGFDCRDAYFYRKENTPWLYAAVYATDVEVPDNPSWYDLAEKRLINDSLVASINTYGYVRLEDIVVTWLDKENYQITN